MTSTTQVGWNVDLKTCIGCRSCFVACKAENRTPLRTDWRFVVEREKGKYPTPKREFISVACNHCVEPACLKSCPVDAITKRELDGAVLIDQDRCNGCRYCVFACPFGAPRIDTETGLVSKCTMCFHRLDGGLQPACADACLTGALSYVADFSGVGSNRPDDFADQALTLANIEFTLQP